MDGRPRADARGYTELRDRRKEGSDGRRPPLHLHGEVTGGQQKALHFGAVSLTMGECLLNRMF